MSGVRTKRPVSQFFPIAELGRQRTFAGTALLAFTVRRAVLTHVCPADTIIAIALMPKHNWGMDSLRIKSIADLLAMHVAIMEELRARDVLRSANNPTGDLAEYVFCAAFGWAQENNSAKAFDATGDDGTRYQIKGRRIHRRNRSRQLSAIRDLDGFDILAAVLFDDDYRIMRAALISAAVVRQHSTYIEHTNSHKFLLRDAIWDAPGVIDVTDRLCEVECA